MSSLRPFHLAIPVADIDSARRFYGDTLGFAEGRSAPDWVDFNCFGHQFVIHHVDGYRGPAGAVGGATNGVDGHDVPVPHFGVVLTVPEFTALAQRLAGSVDFIIAPTLRFAGQVGEQWTMFFADPAGNAIEFKAMADDSQLFAT